MKDGFPREEPDLRLLLHALLDGELDAAAALGLERRIEADPRLQAEHARVAALRHRLQRLPSPQPSEALLFRVASLSEEGSNPQSMTAATAQPPSRRRFDWRAMAASILVSAALASGGTYLAMPRKGVFSIEDAVAASHRRGLLASTPIDVASSDRHTVKPWLDAKLGVSPPTFDLAQEGFTLVGGRVDVIGDLAVPSLVYRHKEHLITLVAAPEPPGRPDVTAPTRTSAGGLPMVHWTDGSYSYWAVSDVERSALDDFVARFRQKSAGG